MPSMQNSIRRLSTTLLAASLVWVASSANSATVKLDGFSNGSTVVNVSTPISPVHAGRYTGKLDGQSFLSFCIDLFQTINFSSTFTGYVAVPAASFSGLTAAKALDLGRLATGYLSLVTSTTNSSAFQLAVWEIAHETGGSYALGSGTFTSTQNGSGSAAAIAQANLWLASLPGASSFEATVLHHASHQDLLTFSHVPVPGALLLLASGLGVFGFLRRRRN